MSKLRFLHPAIGELAVTLRDESSIVLGRKGGSAGIELNWDRRISRRHAQIARSGSQVFFEDLGSSNGSWVGESRIHGRVRFEPGMAVLVGETVIMIAASRAETEDPWTSEVTDVNLERRRDSDSGGFRTPFETEDLTTREMPSAYADPSSRRPHRVTDEEASDGPTHRARFITHDHVELDVPDREAFRRLWQEEIQRAGLFVPTYSPPSFGDKVEIRIDTPDGSVALPATVVHVVDPETAARFRMSPGAGLQIQALKPSVRELLDEYASGRRFELSESTPVSLQTESDQLLARVRSLLRSLDAGRYYEALEIDPKVDDRTLARHVQDLEASFKRQSSAMTPPQLARLDTALQGLAKLRAVLCTPEKRLQYDFRSGHDRVDERLTAAKSGAGPSLSQLREAWNKTFPERVDQAATLMRRAFAAHQIRQLDQAVAQAREALALNPFFEQLETTLREWEKQKKR